MRLNLLLVLLPVCLLGQTQDANYRALRDGKLTESFHTENIELQRDAGTLTFKSGEIACWLRCSAARRWRRSRVKGGFT
jgi:hypothetical protein